MILFLAHEAIQKFKKMFPDEEPFIKITCLRDRRLIEEMKSGKSDWRKLDIIENGEVKKQEDLPKARVKIKKKKVKKLVVFDSSGTEVPNNVRQSHSKRNHTGVDQHGNSHKISQEEYVISVKDEEYEIPENQIDVYAQAEIVTDPCETRLDFISIDNWCNLYGNISESVDTTLPPMETLVSNFETTREGLMKYSQKILNRKSVETETETKEDKELLRKAANMKIDPNVALKKYMDIQEKLNKIKRQLKPFTDVEELKWSELTNKHGFICAIPHLVRFWYEMSPDYNPENEFEFDD